MQLNYKKLGENGSTILILHGLLGSLDNWHTIAKQLALSHQVYILDQRNHGRSPHTKEINYELLAQDVFDFCTQHELHSINLIGHSMGGKVAMLFALLYPTLVNKLIVVDIAPAFYDGGHEDILFAMAEAPLKMATKRDEIDLFLQRRIPEFGVRQFILKNLSRDENNKFVWKCNFESLITHYRLLMDFPTLSTTFLNHTYFIKGEFSNYLNQDNFDTCDRYFPDNSLIEIKNAGHWVHADNPIDFTQKLMSILS